MTFPLRLAFALSLILCSLRAAEPQLIAITTANSAFTLVAAKDGRVYQLSYGRPKTPATTPIKTPSREDEFYPQAGNGFISEPSLQVVHADGNTSTDLIYVRHSSEQTTPVISLTRIELRDPAYPLFVTLCLRAYADSDVIEQWTEIRHEEPQPITLERYASASPIFKGGAYWLTQFHGDYNREVELSEEQLTAGIKILDSKLGVRAHQMRNPSFVLSLGSAAREETGEVIGGTLAWSGSFQFAFDVDHQNRLRALSGINPFGSEYHLAAGKTFTTPAMLWTWSNEGKGGMSRNFHRWARRHGIRDGTKARPVLLNNWEATDMAFDEQKIVSLFDGAREVGAELFLLDDGWFGNKHPRDNDRAGLGDWQVNTKKLPHGLPFLADEAKKRGLGFGIWIEPEMVNPRSELFEQHPDWVIRQPKRELLFGRNQLVLDLTRPEVKEFAWKVVDDTLGASPLINYTKWDCNRFVTQPGSPYLSASEQSHVLIDYQWALYDVMKRMAEKYPQTMAMVCSGGSGRVDYGSLRYFHSFWPSDNTDPAQRVFIQWGFSHFFPSNTIAAHVTDMGHKPLKFALDVALSGAFGIDRDVGRWTPEERKTVAAAVQLYKDRLRELVSQGDLYRLQSPYEKPQAALSYVSADRGHAVVFIYRLGETAFAPVKPRGLDPTKRYRVREINLGATQKTRLTINDQVVTGADLMADGFAAPLRRSLESAVIELTAAP